MSSNDRWQTHELTYLCKGPRSLSLSSRAAPSKPSSAGSNLSPTTLSPLPTSNARSLRSSALYVASSVCTRPLLLIFTAPLQLSIETSALKSSGLGKIVYFYTKCKRVDPFIARMANQLVSDWMRPIIRRSKAFSDKELGTTPARYSSEFVAQQRVKQARESNIARKLEAEGSQGSAGGAVARRHARIPASLSTSFKVAPAADPRERPERAGGAAVSNNVATGTKMKSYKKKLVAGKSHHVVRHNSRSLLTLSCPQVSRLPEGCRLAVHVAWEGGCAFSVR